MALPSSEIDIANMALDFLGHEEVAVISPPITETEQLVARHYPLSRRTCIRKYVPNFAKTRASIARSGTPDYEYEDEYQLPNDYIRLLSVGDDIEERPVQRYDMGPGRKLLVNNGGDASIKIRYLADVEDVTKWDSLFTEKLVLELAIKLCMPITGDKELKGQLYQMLKSLEPEVYAVDGQEVPPKRIDNSPMMARRFGYSTTQYDNRYIRY